ncbi:MAG TPA: hypothetical protein VGE94_12675, partial [Chloroflexota bacterium]
GLADVPLKLFLPGLLLGSTLDLGLHFGLGYVGSTLLASLVAPAPLAIVVGLAALGLGAWFVVAKRRKASAAVALNAWAQATCPVCLLVGSVASLDSERAVRWQGAV